MIIPLDLLHLASSLRTSRKSDRTHVWCLIRKKWLVATPEEYVRQALLLHLTETLHWPVSRISVERQLTTMGSRRRWDIVCYDIDGHEQVLIECKAPEVALSQRVMDQAALYQQTVQSQYILLANGKEAICCTMKEESASPKFLSELPQYDDL